MTIAWLLAAAILLEPAAAAAQVRGATARFAAVKTVTCNFPLYARGGWKDGDPEAEVKPTTLSLKFEDVDTDDGSARAVGSFGASDIIVRPTATALHFVQSFRDGPLYITTVIARQARNGRWLAVHTRHEYAEIDLPGFTSKPEQYYGTCTLEE